MLRPIISENDPQFFAPWVTLAHQSRKKSEALQLPHDTIHITIFASRYDTYHDPFLRTLVPYK